MSEGSGNGARRVAPNNLEAEMSVLCAMMISEDAQADIVQRLQPEDFYKVAHQHIFESIRQLYDRHVEIDHVSLAEELKTQEKLEAVGGTPYLFTLSDFIPSAASAIYHSEIVRQKAVLRRLIQVSTEITTKAYQGSSEAMALLDEAERQIFEIARKGDVGEPKSMEQLVWTTFEKIEKLKKSGGSRTTGVPTGFQDLDNLTAGFQPGELLVIAARPSMGKTSFALNILQRAASEGYGCAFFSLEMTREQVVQNMLCCNAGVDAHKLRRGYASSNEYQRLHEAASRLYEQKIHVDDTANLSLLALRAKGRRLRQKSDIQLLFVDYLQLVTAGGKHDNRQQEISMISRSLKSLAKELEIPVVALSQLNRSVEQRDSHRPRMSDLRESGAIEQDADVVMMLHREEYFKQTEENRGLADVIIAKQRNGPTGTVRLRFFQDTLRFESYLREPEPIA
ncbi:MAG: replicative DNA helicase [Planctomycetota bacterium]